MSNEKKPHVIRANYRLQQKVGSGPIDEKSLQKSQSVIDNNDVDFAPLGLEILKKLEAGLKRVNDTSLTMQQMRTILIAPVMELKANAAIFHYTLIGTLANIMLSFLESVTVLDKDAIEIVKAHHKTLEIIITRQIQGDGGSAGGLLIKELQNACDRYFKRN